MKGIHWRELSYCLIIGFLLALCHGVVGEGPGLRSLQTRGVGAPQADSEVAPEPAPAPAPVTAPPATTASPTQASPPPPPKQSIPSITPTPSPSPPSTPSAAPPSPPITSSPPSTSISPSPPSPSPSSSSSAAPPPPPPSPTPFFPPSSPTPVVEVNPPDSANQGGTAGSLPSSPEVESPTDGFPTDQPDQSKIGNSKNQGSTGGSTGEEGTKDNQGDYTVIYAVIGSCLACLILAIALFAIIKHKRQREEDERLDSIIRRAQARQSINRSFNYNKAHTPLDTKHPQWHQPAGLTQQTYNPGGPRTVDLPSHQALAAAGTAVHHLSSSSAGGAPSQRQPSSDCSKYFSEVSPSSTGGDPNFLYLSGDEDGNLAMGEEAYCKEGRLSIVRPSDSGMLQHKIAAVKARLNSGEGPTLENDIRFATDVRAPAPTVLYGELFAGAKASSQRQSLPRLSTSAVSIAPLPIKTVKPPQEAEQCVISPPTAPSDGSSRNTIATSHAGSATEGPKLLLWSGSGGDLPPPIPIRHSTGLIETKCKGTTVVQPASFGAHTVDQEDGPRAFGGLERLEEKEESVADMLFARESMEF